MDLVREGGGVKFYSVLSCNTIAFRFRYLLYIAIKVPASTYHIICDNFTIHFPHLDKKIDPTWSHVPFHRTMDPNVVLPNPFNVR